MKSVFLSILLSTAFVCNGSEIGTLQFPRQKVSAESFDVTEIIHSGKQWLRILTEHYDITAYRLEEGIQIGEQLEHLYQVWSLLGAEILKKTKNQSTDHRHRIILYGSKEEYIAHLSRLDTGIARSNGYYFAPRKTAYFFSTEAKVLFHEGTHQLLAERFFRDATTSFPNNFWVAEGIALFFETLKIEDECYRMGSIMADRLYSAKIYRFDRKHDLPIEKMTAMSAVEVHTRPDMQQIYSQSATLVHWLMFANNGCYRQSLFELLRQTYHDTAKPETLSKLVGLSFKELDKKYAEFLKTIPE